MPGPSLASKPRVSQTAGLRSGAVNVGFKKVHLNPVAGQLKVGVVGATGAVGQEFLKIFAERIFPISELRLFSSPRTAGTETGFRGSSITLEALSESRIADCDVVFFSAGSDVSREWAPKAQIAIDNSSAFRGDSAIPLVVPEINGDAITAETRIVANPNCSAIILLMAIAPLRKLRQINRVIVSTYQSASGAGALAMQELLDQTQAYLNGEPVVPNVLPHPYAFNLFSHNTAINEHGFNGEEWKVMAESRKILGDSGLRMNVTCVRVPVLRAHTEAVTVEFELGEKVTTESVRECLSKAPGVEIVDDRDANLFPMPVLAAGGDTVLVGRIRRDPSHENAVSLLIAGDQLRKGAALNAVQIAELMLAKGYLGG